MRPFPVRSLLIGTICFGLAACDTQTTFTPTQSPKTNQVSVVRDALPVQFAHASAAVPAGEQQALLEFVRQQPGENPHVSIVAGPATGPSGINERRYKALHALLASRGLKADPGGDSTAGLPANTFLVTVDRYVVTTPNCPDFSKASETNFDNTDHSNFGCASIHNLGVMVADPADLVRGRDAGAQDGAAAVLAVQRYRTGKTTKLIDDSITSLGSSGSSGSN